MNEKEFSDLIKTLIGDRSYREVAKVSGVDSGIISKMVTGKYIPKNSDILKRLTSPDANPQNGVTLEQLIRASKKSKDYEDGMKAALTMLGASATGSVAGLVGGAGLLGAGMLLPGIYAGLISGAVGGAAMLSASLFTKNKKVKSNCVDNLNENSKSKECKISDLNGCAVSETYGYSITDSKNVSFEKIKKLELLLNQFSAVSIGLLLSQMASKDIIFKEKDKDLFEPFCSGNDKCYIVKNCEYEELIVCFVPLLSEDYSNDYYVSNLPVSILSQLMFIKTNKKMKLLIVVNSETLYKSFVKYKDKISFYGNLAVMHVDLDGCRIQSEEFISFVSGDDIEKWYLL